MTKLYNSEGLVERTPEDLPTSLFRDADTTTMCDEASPCGDLLCTRHYKGMHIADGGADDHIYAIWPIKEGEDK